MFVIGYLPQTWAFVSPDETVALSVSRQGTVNVRSGPVDAPDVTVSGSGEELVAVLTRRRSPSAPGAPELKVTTHSTKGRTAFEFLKGRLGL